MTRMLALLGVALFLAACASPGEPPPDPRFEHYLACSAYTAALEKVATWKDLGKFNEQQLIMLRQVEASTTPLCQTETPTMAGADLVRQATASLEALLLTIVSEGG